MAQGAWRELVPRIPVVFGVAKYVNTVKRASAKAAEENFFKLLEERVKNPEPNANWKEASLFFNNKKSHGVTSKIAGQERQGAHVGPKI